MIRAVGVETGGSNVQFAVNPETEEILVIEMNPRVSRSSRAGLEGDRLPDRQDRRAPGGRLRAGGDPQRHHAASRRRASSRRSTTSSSSGRASRSRSSPASTPTLTTHMKSVGEAMAIGRTFQQAFAKAMRSRELDTPPRLDGVDRRDAARQRSSARRPTATTCCSRRSAAARRSTRSRARDRDRPLVPARAARRWRSTPTAPFAGERTFKSVDTCAAEFAARDALLLLGLGAPRAARRGRARRARRAS